MNNHLSRNVLRFGCLLILGCGLAVAQQAPQADLSDYRTVDKAINAKATPSQASGDRQSGYLGVTVQRDGKGQLVVEEVQAESPADKAGLKKGDVLTSLDGRPVAQPQTFREWLQARGPGEAVKLGLLREGKTVEVSATLHSTSRPMKMVGPRIYLGLSLGEAKEGEGVRVDQVTANSPAADAGLKVGDMLFKLDGMDFTRASRLVDVLAEKKQGDVLAFTVRRDGKEVQLKATLAADRGGRESLGIGLWKKDVFRVAVIGIEFPDVKHNAKVTPKDWDESFFSRGLANQQTNPTGQTVHGSLNDYLLEQSAGGLRLEGRVFDWIEAGKKRNDYVQGSGTSNKTALLVEALDKVAARDGKEAFKGFDGFLFLYAGERLPTNRGALYYPHAGIVSFQTQRRPYLLAAEGGSRMASPSSFAKEIGLALGLPDLAARTENVGSEGLGAWCAMSNPAGDGRPQHFCAWSKEKLGWLKPTVIDPTVKQKLMLSPIANAPKECFKVLVRPDGSEYLLLENRAKKGFDQSLPGEGLLIWRVVNDRPILEESHGVVGPTGPTVNLSAVPYPSSANNAFTPDTLPSSRSPLGGGLAIHITEIRRLADGRITFQIGYQYR